MKLAQVIQHLFLPHSSNNHKAKLLQPVGLAFILTAFVALQVFIQSAGGKVLGYAANISVDEVIRLTNERRVENGLSPLVQNNSLSLSAQAKGADMLNKGYWAHVSPDGTEPWAFFLTAGYKYKYAGENLARDFSSASSAVDAWMASSSHRENLLSPKYKEIGIAVVEGDLDGADTTVIVQHFGTTLADQVSLPVAEAKTKETISSPPPVSSEPQEASVYSSPLAAKNQRVIVSPFALTKSVSLGLVGFLLAVMVLDIAIITRRRIKRVSGRALAHVAFFGMIAAIILVMKAGKIL